MKSCEIPSTRQAGFYLNLLLPAYKINFCCRPDIFCKNPLNKRLTHQFKLSIYTHYGCC